LAVQIQDHHQISKLLHRSTASRQESYAGFLDFDPVRGAPRTGSTRRSGEFSNVTSGAFYSAINSRAGFDSAARLGLIEQAQKRAASSAYQGELAIDATVANRAVAQAAEKLGERQSVFASAALREEAGRIGLGKIGYAEISAAVKAATSAGNLIERTFVDRRGAAFSGFTTR
jgi:hypothetical protein